LPLVDVRRDRRRPSGSKTSVGIEVGQLLTVRGFSGVGVPYIDEATWTKVTGQNNLTIAPVGADPDHYQDAQPVLFQAYVDVDPVDPHVHEVELPQVPGRERAGLVLPLHR
jgi:hypothetical protein